MPSILPPGITFVDIPPLFEPGAPPATRPPPPVAQTEVGRTQTPHKLLAQEEIGASPRRDGHKSTRFFPYVKDSPTRASRSSARRSPTPAPKASTSAGKSCDVTPLDQDSESTSGGSNGSDDDNLIPKPEGEAGRPGRGGYNFEEALGWKKKEFQKLKKFMKELIDEHLDTSKNLTRQSEASIESVRMLAIEKFPSLNDYEDAWPVTDFIRIQLKYSCGKAKAAGKKVGKFSNKSQK